METETKPKIDTHLTTYSEGADKNRPDRNAFSSGADYEAAMREWNSKQNDSHRDLVERIVKNRRDNYYKQLASVASVAPVAASASEAQAASPAPAVNEPSNAEQKA